MKKRVLKTIVTTVLAISMFSQSVMAFKLPDVGKMASEAASGRASCRERV